MLDCVLRVVVFYTIHFQLNFSSDLLVPLKTHSVAQIGSGSEDGMQCLFVAKHFPLCNIVPVTLLTYLLGNEQLQIHCCSVSLKVG